MVRPPRMGELLVPTVLLAVPVLGATYLGLLWFADLAEWSRAGHAALIGGIVVGIFLLVSVASLRGHRRAERRFVAGHLDEELARARAELLAQLEPDPDPRDRN